MVYQIERLTIKSQALKRENSELGEGRKERKKAERPARCSERTQE